MSWLDPFEASRRALAAGPSPLVVHPSLGAELGVTLLLKRDDCLDDCISGNKIRKLEYIVGDALARGADTLITAGSTQSNQCKAVAVVARRLGLECHLAFCDRAQPAVARGNYLLDLVFGARRTWVDASQWGSIAGHLERIRERESAAGRRPYVIAPGASSWLGALGYARMAGELAHQEAEQGLRIDHVVAPTGSGGTQTGLVIGAAMLPRRWRVTGVCVLGDRAYFERLHTALVDELIDRARIRPATDLTRLHIHDGATGGGYDCYGPAELDEMVRVARTHGVLLDPTYMLKAFVGLRDLVRDGSIRRGATVVLLHTGGTYGVLAGEARLDRYLRARHGEWFAPAAPTPEGVL